VSIGAGDGRPDGVIDLFFRLPMWLMQLRSSTSNVAGVLRSRCFRRRPCHQVKSVVFRLPVVTLWGLCASERNARYDPVI